MKPPSLIAVSATLLLAAPLGAQSVGLKAPPGFEVAEYADSSLANDIYCMTTDARGRIVVAGRGYIRVLVEDAKAGRAARAIDFAAEPKDGAMGLLWEGDTLFVTGDGGLRRFRDADGDGKADGPSELIRALKTGGEHAAHALRRGPDGRLYLLCGNNTAIGRTYATLPTSPVKEPIAGCVLRFSPDLTRSEIVAHGFRNPYGMDFTADGALYTFDSDNERCVSLPWYEPTRLYQVVAGGFYGWLSPQRASFWRMPPYFFDVMAPVATLGRGSPTGVACYRHVQFPERYRGGLFLCDWTFGRIYFASLKAEDRPVRPEVFLSSVGDNGFAPTAAVVHPTTGDLFISTGGRGTRGAVYRVRYPQGLKGALAAGATPVRPGPLGGEVIGASDWRSLEVSLQGNADALREATVLLSDRAHPDRQLKAVRLVQRYLGDIGAPKSVGTIWEGYTRRRPDPATSLGKSLAALFPSGHADLDREIARTLAMLEYADAGLRERVLGKIDPQSEPVEDVHYLAVYARLPGERRPASTTSVAAALLDLDRKIAERRLNRDSNWPLRIGELYAGLAQRDPALHEAVLGHFSFGRPDHALFTEAPGFPRRRAAALFLKRIRARADYRLSTTVIHLLGELPAAEVAPVLRERWGQAGQDAAILPILARAPVAADRTKFIDGLATAQPTTVRACADGLARLGLPDDGGEALALLLALKRLPDNQKDIRAAVLGRLRLVTGKSFPADNPAWIRWMAETHPQLAARLTNPDGVDVAAWNTRLARLDWQTGDANRGQAVFQKANCASCHSGSQAVGPDLTGVASRFSRADLFTAIVQPSRDVPTRYQMTVVETDDGKVYQGLVIYDAVDSLLLQTGPSVTVRLDGHRVIARRSSPVSLMPAGLLDRLSDQDVVDLYAYLRTLGTPRKN